MIFCARRAMNSEDTDVIFVPLSLSFSFINPRHSYPPLRCLSSMPVQHIMRSYSDSHLFLKLAAATGSAAGGAEDEDRTSWYSGGELWDMDYVQHWLRLDETRTAIQQRMEYDAAELEDWTMDDGAGTGWKRLSSVDGKQQSLPCIEEDDANSSTAGGGSGGCKGDDELLGSAKDMSWHHFHHHHHNLSHQQQPHHQHQNQLQHHPLQQLPPSFGSGGSPGGDSWSSADDYAAAESPPSKRSSLSCSDSIELLPPPGPIAGTDFTRDFYRLVKFESSKSLASTSSRSVTGCGGEYRRPPVVEAQLDREQALQSVLDFIAEQQQYCLSRQAEDKRDPPPQVASPTAVPTATASSTSNQPTATSDPDDDCGITTTTVVVDDLLSLSSDRPLAPPPPPPPAPTQQTCDSNSCSDNQLLNSKDSGLCGSDVEIECLPEDCYSPTTGHTAASTPRSTLLRTVPEEDEESSAKSTSPQPPSSSTGVGGCGSSSVCTADTAVMVTWAQDTSSKDLIEQLNRMVADGPSCTSPMAAVQHRSLSSSSSSTSLQTDLDEACCCPTGWVHVERDIDFADPKVRPKIICLNQKIKIIIMKVILQCICIICFAIK